jgi:hypothetical protein
MIPKLWLQIWNLSLSNLRLRQDKNLVKMVDKKVQRVFLLTFLTIHGRVTAQNATNVLQYVDPLIGSANGGLSIATSYLNEY